jgi:hypothetical protein
MAPVLVNTLVAAPVERMRLTLEEPTALALEAAEDGYGALEAIAEVAAIEEVAEIPVIGAALEEVMADAAVEAAAETLL